MSGAPVRALFAVPGDIETPTGGYIYDRRVLARLADHGVAARHVALPGSFPNPSAADVEATRAALAARAPGEVALVDGLAWGALPPDVARGLGPGVVALCHHPLGLETGLAADAAQALIANERATLAAAERVIVSSATTRDTLVADFGVPAEKIAVAEPGVDRAPPARGSGGPGVALLAVGSVVPRKGYDVLLAALETLADLDWRLVVAGATDRAPDHARDVAERLARSPVAGRVTFAGALDDAALGRLYDGADLFVSASHYEGYGMVLTEALARGLPMVASTGGAAARTVPDAAALKVAPGDASALAAALRRAIDDAGLRSRLAAGARAAIADLPTWDAAAARVADALRAVAERTTR